MNKTKWKEIALYGLAVVAAKGQFVGCYPLIPGFFAAAFMEEVNRTLLLVFSIFGMDIHKRDWSEVLFFGWVLVWFRYQSNCGFIE